MAGGALIAGLMASSASAATFGTSSAAARPGSGLAQTGLTGAGVTGAAPTGADLTGSGSISGIVQASSAAPLEGICVTARGPSGSRLGITGQDGRFLISALRPGEYSLQYRACTDPGRYVPQWYGGTPTQAGSRPVPVAGSGMTPVAPVTLRPQVLSAVPPAVAGTPAEQAMSLLHGTRAGAPSARLATRSMAPVGGGGRISGRVTDRAGQPLSGICVLTVQNNGRGYTQTRTGARGYYTSAGLPAGRYVVFFFTGCGNSGNWLGQVYKDSANPARPTVVRVTAGKATGNIDAVLQRGGEISGTVTNGAGKRLSNICVFPVAAGDGDQGELIQQAVSRNGAFHVRGVPPGGYQVNFSPCNIASPYTSVWWKNAATQQQARVIRVANLQHVSHIDQVIPLAGKITGVVTASTAAGPPLAGICVDALPTAADGAGAFGFTVTAADGSYVLAGLPAGGYQLQFSTGCRNNGNYLPETYPGVVTVTDGTTDAGINGVLPLGAQVSGVVTNSGAHPVGGICVTVAGGPGDIYGNQTQTAANGSYAVDQLAAGSYAIQFSGGCGNRGSYAPQGYDGTNVNTPQEVPVAAGQLLSGINAVLQPGATLDGRVTSGLGRGLGGVCVLATTPGSADLTGFSFLVAGGGVFPVSPGPLGVLASGLGITGPGGRYRIRNLQPGQYQVAFVGGCGSRGDLAAQWYSARPGPGPAAIIYAGARHPTAGIDLAMQAGGAISGTIRSASGRKIAACVQVTDLNRNVQLPLTQAVAFGGSTYRLSGLPAGRYHVTFLPGCAGLNYATQWYPRRPSPAGAAPVIVRAGQTTAGIDSALTPGGSITGLVTSASSHAALRNVCVFAQNVTQPDDYGFGFSNRNGRYVVTGLNTGRYDMQFTRCAAANSANLAGPARPSLVRVVAARQTSGINAAMAVGGWIQGQVTAGSTGPAQGVCVDAIGANGSVVSAAITEAAGGFRIAALAAGRYRVVFGDPACPDGPYNVVPQWYSGKPGPAGAMSVTVTGGTVTSEIDADLALDGSVTGAVRGPAGAPLNGVCVAAVRTVRGAQPVIAVSGEGGYTMAGLTPGRYRVEFYAGCGARGYVTQWWRRAGSAKTAAIVVVHAGSTVSGISATLRR